MIPKQNHKFKFEVKKRKNFPESVSFQKTFFSLPFARVSSPSSKIFQNIFRLARKKKSIIQKYLQYNPWKVKCEGFPFSVTYQISVRRTHLFSRSFLLFFLIFQRTFIFPISPKFVSELIVYYSSRKTKTPKETSFIFQRSNKRTGRIHFQLPETRSLSF